MKAQFKASIDGKEISSLQDTTTEMMLTDNRIGLADTLTITIADHHDRYAHHTST